MRRKRGDEQDKGEKEVERQRQENEKTGRYEKKNTKGGPKEEYKDDEDEEIKRDGSGEQNVNLSLEN